MRNYLTWLHISDIHFHPKTEWRDSVARKSLLDYLETIFKKDNSLRPDMIFCTGDIAFGETGTSPLLEQYKDAQSFFDKLLTVCGRDGADLQKNRLFLVPGNHDLNRDAINPDSQATLSSFAMEADKHVDEINQLFNDQPSQFEETIKRLDEYSVFIRDYLPHQVDLTGRHRFAKIIDIEGLRIGIAGFNSAWSCAGPEDDRNIWLAAEWQFNAAKNPLEEAFLRIGLIHHPTDWLNEADRKISTRRISTDFDFWLHGHAHDAWVSPLSSHMIISAGAIGTESSDESGFNLVKLDLSKSNGIIYLHQRKKGDSNWTIAPVSTHAPEGHWPLHFLPSRISKITSHALPVVSIENKFKKRRQKLFGRDAIIKQAKDKLNKISLLLVYGFRGNGKSSLIRELGKETPLLGKQLVQFSVFPTTKADELFRQVAVLLGDTAEHVKVPEGNVRSIVVEIKKRYPNPQPAWVWIDRAHQLLDVDDFRDPKICSLLLGLQEAFACKWHWIFEMRERPPINIFPADICDKIEVPGLDKKSLSECLLDAAPTGRESEWRYTGVKLKSMYQWLGGGHGAQAHPQAIQLLIEVALGRNETPLQVLQRHRGDVNEKIEEKLLGDLYDNVLNFQEQEMLKALSLYRTSIPHDHAEVLEKELSIPGAWDGLDRRCLLSTTTEHSLYFLHSFIAGWVRYRHLGYSDNVEEDEIDFLKSATEETQQHSRSLQSVVATSWLKQLGKSKRATNLNMGRALEAFHHLVLAGESERIQEIAVSLFTGNLEWAKRRINTLSKYLHKTKAPLSKRRRVLEYQAALDPEDHLVQQFLGRCWEEEKGKGNKLAQKSYENACRLRPDLSSHWIDLGINLRKQGKEGALIFLSHLEALEKDCYQGVNDQVRAIQADCFKIAGMLDKASALRMLQIKTGSSNAAFYNDEARARLDADDPNGALEILDLAEKNECTNDYIDATRATALQKIDPNKASDLRMAKINAKSKNSVFYNYEAQARLNAHDPDGALEILDLAENIGCTDDVSDAIRATVYNTLDPGKASLIRIRRINAGSSNAALYVDEAKARLDAGDPEGALEILDLAYQNRSVDNYTEAIRARVFQVLDPGEASFLRLKEINAGSRNVALYSGEAKARLDAGDSEGALEILDLAENIGCTDDVSDAIRATVYKRLDPQKAFALRIRKISAGSSNAALYADEAKARIDAGDPKGALEILDLADKNCKAEEIIEAIRATALQLFNPEEASTLRMKKIKAGSSNAAFYNDEAKARRDSGDLKGAIEILDLADKNKRANKHTESLRLSIFPKIYLG